MIGQEQIVGVEQRHEVGPGDAQSGVAGRGLPAVWLTDKRDRSLPLRLPLERNLGGAVSRAIVDHDDLLRRSGLRQDTVERFPEEEACVVGRDEHADRDTASHLGHPDAVRLSRRITPAAVRDGLPRSSSARAIAARTRRRTLSG